MPVLARIFVASYAIAIALAITQMFARSPLRGALVIGFAWAGFLVQTAFLYQRAVTASGTPLSSPFDWDLLGAWALVIVYLYLSWYHPKAALGLFLLPLALGLIGLSHFADHEPFAHSEAGQVWGMIHGIFNLLGVVAVLVGFVAGMMYLIQSYRLKHKLPPTGQLGLPSLEWLERINSRAIVISVLMIGIGFISGVILNVALRHRQLDELPWSDPVIWRSALMFGWLLAAAVFSAIYKPARSGRKVAYLTVASFAFLAVSMGIRVLIPSEHGANPTRNAQSPTLPLTAEVRA
jgi:ABC-type transport system involved in cytochrome c biogenesis permease subunit